MEMEIATCSDIDTELETNMERVAINDYFRGVDANTLSSSYTTPNRLREKTKISKLRDKHNNMKMSLFAETIGGVRYIQFISISYLDCAYLEIWGTVCI
jgi:hypothetical protein